MDRRFRPPVESPPLLVAAMARRLKHWGWGYEDQAPSRSQLEEAAAGIRDRLGLGGEVEDPVPLEEVEIRAPRLKAPSGFGDLFCDEKYERVSHALGKSYRGPRARLSG